MIVKYDAEKVRNEIFREIYESEHPLVNEMTTKGIVDREIKLFEELFGDVEQQAVYFAGFIISNYVQYQQLALDELENLED